MPHIHTHYDNLKVARDAPPEVIRAAYKTLSQKFHPDRNPDKPTATRTFQLINLAYEVLSDPVRRKAHDDWIAAEEAKEQPVETSREAEHLAKTAQRNAAHPVPQPPAFHLWKTRSRKSGYYSFAAARKEWTSINRIFKYFFWLLLPTLILLIVVAV
jgi:curved DNA-binding protein CbpA